MYDTTFTELMNTTILMMAVVLGFFFLMMWRRDLQRNRRELSLQKGTLEEIGNQTNNQNNYGGFITIDIPEKHRSLFHDFLKGFEDYAKIRGYKVSFSVDSSHEPEFKFKFTILDSGISVSTDRVRNDFNEYLRKVESGEPLDDLPVIVSDEEHALLLTCLKNRVNFLQHSYNLSKHTIEYYEKLLKAAPLQSGFHSAPPVIVQTGGQLESRSYNAPGAQNVVQGEYNQLTQISNDNSVSISNSFNERKNQIDELAKLIELIKTTSDNQAAQKAVVELEKVKGELEDEESPDTNRISKWLQNAKNCLGNVKMTKELFDTAKGVYQSFNVSEWIESLSQII